MGRGNKMARPLIYDRGFSNNVIGDVDSTIKNLIISQLSNNCTFINTTWIEDDIDLKNIINIDKTSICYSGPDWENTQCIDIRRNAHNTIKENSKDVLHIGNSIGVHYFNFWAEFIRQHSESFFNPEYTSSPNFNKLFMCLNRKPHNHRKFLINLLRFKNLMQHGIISFGDDVNPIVLNETLSQTINLGEAAVSGSMIIKNDIVSLGDPELWKQHFINVVTETTVHTDVFISEKTWKPIIGLRPFLILGDNKIYYHLKDLGFDTFDDILGLWHEDPNWENRAKSITAVLDQFRHVNISKVYNEMLPRLIKNRNRFLTYMQENRHKIENLI
jgi:hypothetical protein